MFGKNIGRDWASTNRQDTLMGLVNATWRHAFNDKNALSVTAALAYGSTENDLKSFFQDASRAHADWTNHAFNAVLQASWDFVLPQRFVLSPSLGLEYTDVKQNAFTETGDIARRFDKGHYRNLSLPVGVSLQKTFELPNGKNCVNTLSFYYVPDICRDQPDGRATLSGYSWDVYGSSVARNAFRATFASRLALTSSLEAFCSYALEARDGANMQACSLGLGYSF